MERLRSPVPVSYTHLDVYKRQQKMFVVLGATGHTGAVVAETLLARKQSVRVVVRSADKGAAWKLSLIHI